VVQTSRAATRRPEVIIDVIIVVFDVRGVILRSVVVTITMTTYSVRSVVVVVVIVNAIVVFILFFKLSHLILICLILSSLT
jgi:hypothetical protein